uniref:DUF834 domain-containing protein n=1 Tax=Oryza meridionalis TaxID=40149 RepID=A0A0E0EPS8_9ORYZ
MVAEPRRRRTGAAAVVAVVAVVTVAREEARWSRMASQGRGRRLHLADAQRLEEGSKAGSAQRGTTREGEASSGRGQFGA